MSNIDKSVVEDFLVRHPEAILVGESVLHAVGWVTQIPAQLSVALIEGKAPAKIPGFAPYYRSREWFAAVHPIVDAVPDEGRVYGYPTLPAPFALADLFGDSKAWHPDCDDLEVPEDECYPALAAFQRLGIECPNALAGWLVTHATRHRISIRCTNCGAYAAAISEAQIEAYGDMPETYMHCACGAPASAFELHPPREVPRGDCVSQYILLPGDSGEGDRDSR